MATTPIPRPLASVARGDRHKVLRRTFGVVALATLVLGVAALAAGAATHPSGLVPAARSGGFPGWLAGPLHGLGFPSSTGSYEALLVAIFAAYLVALGAAQRIGSRQLWIAIVLAHLAALAAPPLLSADVFGYVSFGRLGAVHGLDPYTHSAAAVPSDPVYRFVAWRGVSSPYGPLFTLISYALAPLGVPAALWSFKLIAALASLATIAIVGRIAAQLGRSPAAAVAFLGLNPLVLVFVVGGAHNDTLLELLIAAGLWAVLTGREASGAAAFTATLALKATGLLALPFALVRLRGREALRRSVLAAIAVLVAVLAVAFGAFGPHVRAFEQTLRGQQQFVAIHSIPSELSRLLGLGRLAGGVRAAFDAVGIVAFVGLLAHAARHRDRWIDAYGWATLALLLCTAWLLPWYGLWLLVPAALSGDRRLRGAALVLSAYLVATRMPVTNGLLG